MTRSDFAASSAGGLVADDPVRAGEVERRPVTGRALSVSTGYRLATPGGGSRGWPRVAPRVPIAASRMRGPAPPVPNSPPGVHDRSIPCQPQGLTRVRCRGLQAHNRRMFVELHTRHDARHTASLEWDHDSDETQIVVADKRSLEPAVFPVPCE